MKAVAFHEFGHVDVLRVEELPDPAPGPGEVVVEVTASALNHLDVDVRESNAATIDLADTFTRAEHGVRVDRSAGVP